MNRYGPVAKTRRAVGGWVGVGCGVCWCVQCWLGEVRDVGCVTIGGYGEGKRSVEKLPLEGCEKSLIKSRAKEKSFKFNGLDCIFSGYIAANSNDTLW